MSTVATKKDSRTYFSFKLYSWLDDDFKQFVIYHMGYSDRKALYHFTNQILSSRASYLQAEKTLNEISKKALNEILDAKESESTVIKGSFNRVSHPNLSLFYDNAPDGEKGSSILSAFHRVYEGLCNNLTITLEQPNKVVEAKNEPLTQSEQPKKVVEKPASNIIEEEIDFESADYEGGDFSGSILGANFDDIAGAG